ncbi:MAG: glycosyltransferase family 9 protein [Pirellulales bacterium]
MKKSFDTADDRAKCWPRQQAFGRYRYVRLRWRSLFALIDSVGWFAVGVGRCLAWLFRSHAAAKRDPKSILLVQLDHLGDAVITTVMLPALRRRWPEASIEVLAGAWNREVFEACPEVDRVYVSHVNRFSRRDRFGWTWATLWWGWFLRRRKFDLAIDVRGEFPLALILRLSGAKHRLGWNCGGGGFLLTQSPKYVPNRPEVESRLALLAELGIEPDAEETWRPRFSPASEMREEMALELAELGPADRPLFVLHIGSGTRAKRWPVKHWRALLGQLIVDYGARIVLVGDAEDRLIGRRITRERPWPGVADWTGRLSIVQLAAILESAHLFVGADSGPAHLAAAVGTPVVALFSGTNDSRQWQPAGHHVAVVCHEVACSPCHGQECHWAEHPCMNRLQPAEVMAAIETLRQGLSDRTFPRWLAPAPELVGQGRRRPKPAEIVMEEPSSMLHEVV